MEHRPLLLWMVCNFIIRPTPIYIAKGLEVIVQCKGHEVAAHFLLNSLTTPDRYGGYAS